MMMQAITPRFSGKFTFQVHEDQGRLERQTNSRSISPKRLTELGRDIQRKFVGQGIQVTVLYSNKNEVQFRESDNAVQHEITAHPAEGYLFIESQADFDLKTVLAADKMAMDALLYGEKPPVKLTYETGRLFDRRV